MLSAASPTFVVVVLSLLLSSCASRPFAYAYCNQRKDTVTIVEHRWNRVERSTLEADVRQFPGEGQSFPDHVEFFSSSGRQIAIFTRDDYERSRDPNLPPMLVVSRSGVAFASQSFLDKMDREWEPAQHPSHPVAFSGGDGSSLDRAIIVHAQDDRDEGAAHYTYMRERFGYPWTYSRSELGVRFTEDKIYDVYSFVTHDGRKHVLYFDTTKVRAGMVKRI